MISYLGNALVAGNVGAIKVIQTLLGLPVGLSVDLVKDTAFEASKSGKISLRQSHLLVSRPNILTNSPSSPRGSKHGAREGAASSLPGI